MEPQLRSPYTTEEFTARYDISSEQLQDLSARFLETQPKLPDSAGFVGYTIEADSQYSNIGRALEHEVFLEAFGNDAELLEAEYGPYESASKFFVVFSAADKRPAGVLRVIENSEEGLKTLNDIEHEPLNLPIDSVMEAHNIESLDDCWDIGTLAVLPEYRGKGLKSHWAAIMLYRAMYTSAMEQGVKHMVTIMDKRAHKGMQIMGIPLKPIMDSESFSYLDSAVSTALHGDIPTFYDEMAQHLEKLKDEHYFKSFGLRRAMGRLMLGNHIDKAIKL